MGERSTGRQSVKLRPANEASPLIDRFLLVRVRRVSRSSQLAIPNHLSTPLMSYRKRLARTGRLFRDTMRRGS